MDVFHMPQAIDRILIDLEVALSFVSSSCELGFPSAYLTQLDR